MSWYLVHSKAARACHPLWEPRELSSVETLDFRWGTRSLVAEVGESKMIGRVSDHHAGRMLPASRDHLGA